MFEDAVAELDDAELVAVIRFWERAASLAAAGQLAAIAELARRRPRSSGTDGPAGRVDAGDPLVPEVSEFAVDEVAAALRLSRPAAGARLHVAVELTRLPAAAAALADGVLDLPKTRAIVDAVSVLDAEAALAVTEQVLPRAGRQTAGQLRAALSRAAVAADPAAAEKRHERAFTGRQVTLQPARDGMAELWALLPADAAVAVYQHVDAVARRSAAGGRTMDARRADALVTVVLAPAPPTPARPPAGGPHGAGPHGPGPHGPGPHGPGALRNGALRTGAVPDGTVGAGAVEIRPRADGAASEVGAGAALGVEGVDGAPVIRAANVYVTVPVATAVGLSAEPGELAGYGPVPASMARRLADDAGWRKVGIDPDTGAVLEVGRTAYTPSAALAELVRTRDRTCRFPGCRQPARRCDLDHVLAWPAGPTTTDNLAALCRHQQRLSEGMLVGWTSRASSGPGGVTSPG